MDRKLGRRPPKNAPALMFASFRKAGIAPAPLSSVDHFSGVKTWILGGNNDFGTCGPTSVANLFLLVTSLRGAGITVTKEDVFDLYRRSGNPNFDPITGADDNGVDVQTMLEALKAGGIGGHKPAAFVKLNHKDLNEMWDAIHLFGGIILGVNLEVAQQSQYPNWDYVRTADWGGHAICVGKYITLPDLTSCISWQQVYGMTDRFLESPGFQAEEAWGIIWPENLANLTADEYAAFVKEYEAVTGDAFPLPFPGPNPNPGPAPIPTPIPTVDTNDKTLAASVKTWVGQNHSGATKKVATAIKTWLKAKGL